jgi:hypothetical protein
VRIFRGIFAFMTGPKSLSSARSLPSTLASEFDRNIHELRSIVAHWVINERSETERSRYRRFADELRAVKDRIAARPTPPSEEELEIALTALLVLSGRRGTDRPAHVSGHSTLAIEPQKAPRVLAAIAFSGPPPSEEEAHYLAEQVRALGQLLGLELVEDPVPSVGSWLKRFLFKAKETLNAEEVRKRIDALEDGLRAQAVDRPKAESALLYAEVIERIMSAVNKSPGRDRVAFLMDTLLVMKYPGADGHCC